MERRLRDFLRDPNARFRFAFALFVASIIGWPLSALTWAAHEPPFVLGLSWLAITLTALDIMATTDVRREQHSRNDS